MAGISTVVTIATPPIHNITPSTWSTLANANSSIKVAPDAGSDFIARIYCRYLLPYRLPASDPDSSGKFHIEDDTPSIYCQIRGAPHFPWNHVAAARRFP